MQLTSTDLTGVVPIMTEGEDVDEADDGGTESGEWEPCNL